MRRLALHIILLGASGADAAPVVDDTDGTARHSGRRHAFRSIEHYVTPAQEEAARKGAMSQSAQAMRSSNATASRVDAKRGGGMLGFDRPGVWHAQSMQDQRVAAIFNSKRRGYFVDLAANEPSEDVPRSSNPTAERAHLPTSSDCGAPLAVVCGVRGCGLDMDRGCSRLLEHAGPRA